MLLVCLLLSDVRLGYHCDAGSLTVEPTVMLQLSDIHCSVNHKKFLQKFGDRVGDAKLFASEVVPRLNPAALVITGDLTDSKTAQGSGKQHRDEWVSYREVLQSFIEKGGVAEDRIFDIRGNHDVFNLAHPRYSELDHFGNASAWAARTGRKSTRVLTAAIFPVAQKRTPPSSTKTELDSVAAITNWRRLHQQGHVDERTGLSTEDGCPVAFLIGIDFSEDPGLRNPFNFVGHSDESLSIDVQDASRDLVNDASSVCHSEELNRVPFISFGHYPLATVDHHHYHYQQQHQGRYSSLWTSIGIVGGVTHAFFSSSVESMQGVARILADIPASLYVSGHLHSQFGEKLHRVHPNSNGSGGFMNELETSAWKDERRFRVLAVDSGVVAFADLHFHTATSPHREDKIYTKARKGDDWRIRFKHRGWGITSADTSAIVLDHIVLRTWPPDARYGLPRKLSEALSETERMYKEYGEELDEDLVGSVRAMVFSLPSTNSSSSGIVQNESFRLVVNGFLPDGTRILRANMSRSGIESRESSRSGSEIVDHASPVMYSTAPRIEIFCTSRGSNREPCQQPSSFIDLQISLIDSDGSLVAASAKQPAGLLCKSISDDRQKCKVVPSIEPLPLVMFQSLVERFTLMVNWPVLMYRVFFLLWGFYFGVLIILPKKLSTNKRLVHHIVSYSHFRGMTTLESSERRKELFQFSARRSRTPSPARLDFVVAGKFSQMQPLPSDDFESQIDVCSSSRFLSFFMWPYAALILTCRIQWIWMCLLLYSTYFVVGPLFLAELMTGTPPALVFHFGCFGKFYGVWQSVATADTLLVAMTQFLMCIIPMTLWVGCVIGRQILISSQMGSRNGAASHGSITHANANRSANGTSSGQPVMPIGAILSAPQACALLVILLLSWRVLYSTAWDLLGGMALALSPGFFWTIPLAVGLVVRSRESIASIHCLSNGEGSQKHE